jgi:dTDP-4-amino-4,6-dideoxygalactose transaminase
MINVTKTYLPPFEEYAAILKRSWDKGWITNNGELVQELESKLKDYLQVSNLFFTNNGTSPLQMALKVFDITGEVITTPFSYVATTNAILWEGCQPVFVDIDPNTLCIDAGKIESAITSNTQAILATHVYGYPCDVEEIEKIAKAHNLKVIYDGAHAFGCEYNGKSLLSYGDISTCSFHATKIFHTVEGGCIITGDRDIARKLYLYRQFGHEYDDYISIGINAKNSEFHAAMGLTVFPLMQEIIASRKLIVEQYEEQLKQLNLSKPKISTSLKYNYSYFPVIFKSEEELLKIKKALEESDVFCRRYFYPSLNTLSFLKKQSCPVSEDISSRVLCLPLYYGITLQEIKLITAIILRNAS